MPLARTLASGLQVAFGPLWSRRMGSSVTAQMPLARTLASGLQVAFRPLWSRRTGALADGPVPLVKEKPQR